MIVHKVLGKYLILSLLLVSSPYRAVLIIPPVWTWELHERSLLMSCKFEITQMDKSSEVILGRARIILSTFWYNSVIWSCSGQFPSASQWWRKEDSPDIEWKSLYKSCKQKVLNVSIEAHNWFVIKRKKCPTLEAAVQYLVVIIGLKRRVGHIIIVNESWLRSHLQKVVYVSNLWSSSRSVWTTPWSSPWILSIVTSIVCDTTSSCN